MEPDELSDDLWEMLSTKTSNWVPRIPYVHGLLAKWKLGPFFTEKVREYVDQDGTYVSEACAVCVAIQVSGPNSGLQAIAKVRMQIPNPEGERTIPRPNGLLHEREIQALTGLSQRGCTCIPKLLDQRELLQDSTDHVAGGFCVALFMEKVPGKTLENFPELPISERNKVRLAFSKSLRQFYSAGYRHGDEACRNLIWDREREKCYIIDFEEVHKCGYTRDFIPEIEWPLWGIEGPGLKNGAASMDPMVPTNRAFVRNPDDETLESWAAESIEKKPK
ncbi:hypothetical protein FQN53_009096 [Emmonsiellopsis sp. PD_33]|nr:hypothetical protein FQN53_009096 [Emmonsiellopsis sp. PD_33]